MVSGLSQTTSVAPGTTLADVEILNAVDVVHLPGGPERDPSKKRADSLHYSYELRSIFLVSQKDMDPM